MNFQEKIVSEIVSIAQEEGVTWRHSLMKPISRIMSRRKEGSPFRETFLMMSKHFHLTLGFFCLRRLRR